MERPTIYLAGPMGGKTWREALDWRVYVDKELSPRGWHCLSPLKAQIDDQDLDSAIPTPIGRDSYEKPLPLVSSAFVAQDEFYVRKSDWVLANFLGAEKVSLGTVWELGFAYALGKQVISVFEPGSVHDHAFLRRRSHIFVPSLEDAVGFLKGIAG